MVWTHYELKKNDPLKAALEWVPVWSKGWLGIENWKDIAHGRGRGQPKLLENSVANARRRRNNILKY